MLYVSAGAGRVKTTADGTVECSHRAEQTALKANMQEIHFFHAINIKIVPGKGKGMRGCRELTGGGKQLSD